MKSSRDSLARSSSTRRTATVTISAPEASIASLVSGPSLYFPVPTINRDPNVRPAITNSLMLPSYRFSSEAKASSTRKRRSIDQTDSDARNDPLQQIRYRRVHRDLRADIQVDVVVQHKRADGVQPDQRTELCSLHQARARLVEHRVEYRQHHHRQQHRGHTDDHVAHLALLIAIDCGILHKLRAKKRQRAKQGASQEHVRHKRAERFKNDTSDI